MILNGGICADRSQQIIVRLSAVASFSKRTGIILSGHRRFDPNNRCCLASGSTLGPMVLAIAFRHSSVAPEAFEPIRRQRGVARRVLDVAVSQVGLQGPRIDAVIRQLEAAGVLSWNPGSGE